MKNIKERIEDLRKEIEDLKLFIGTIDEKEVLKIIKERDQELVSLQRLLNNNQHL